MNGRTIINFISCVLLLIGININAQVSSHQYSFNYYSTAQGLSNNSVICTIQDNLGYLWIGTKDGLNRFDGRNFKVYRKIPGDKSSLSNNFISKIYQDRDSTLWIGTRGGGLCHYNRRQDSFTTYPFIESDTGSLSHPEVLSMFQDSDGILWIGTEGGGLNKMNSATGKFQHFDHILPEPGGLSSLKILTISEYDKDNLILGTWDGGINIFNKNTGLSKVLNIGNSPLNSNTVWLIQKEGDIGFWIGYFEKGLQFWNRKTNTFEVIKFPVNSSVSTYSIVKQLPDRLWIGTNAGIFTTRITVNNGQLTYQPLTLLNRFFSLQLTIVENESLWAANFDNGLMHIHLNDPQFKITEISDKPSSINLFVNSFIEYATDKIFIGTNQGLWNYEINKNKLSYLEDLNDNSSKRITCFCKDKEGEIYAGKSMYLAKIRGNKLEHFLNIPKNLNSYDRVGYYDLFCDSIFLWLGTENGLFRYGLKSRKISALIPNNTKFKGYNIYQVRSVDSDEDYIYAATLGGGLIVIPKNSGDYKVFQNQNDNKASLASNNINQVFVSKNGNVWLATFNGLVLFDRKNERFRHFGIKEGFQAEFLTAITEDKKGNLWISSQQGLTKYNPENQNTENYFFYNQGSEKSFQVNSVYNGSDGRIYFGRRGGFISFFPDSIKMNSDPPPVLITDIKINNQNVKVSENGILKSNIESIREIKLSHDQNSISFLFAAMDFTFAERNKYAYMLENFDNDWIYTNSTEANYTKLPPGHYVFRVKASNLDGIWNNKGVFINIIIEPAIWQTWFFKIMVIISIIVLTSIWYSRRLLKIKRDKIQLQQLVNVRTKELSDANLLLEEQNEELKLHKEELQNQRDTLEVTNSEIEEKKQEIEHKNAELEQHRENLENLILERTYELSLAKEKAEQSDRLKSAFLANLSHEIRTPLNAIVGFSSLFDKPDLTAGKINQYNGIIQSSSESLLVLIDDILNLAKIETDQIEINPQSFSANQLIQEIFLVFSQKKENKNVELILSPKLPKQTVFIYSDPIRVKQILTNFITNSLKFTETGFIEIGFITKEPSDLHFFVKDTGMGIKAHNFDVIFERFQKLETDADKFFQGAGLGLAISKKLSEMLGARIWLESEYGKGSSFYLSFNYFTFET